MCAIERSTFCVLYVSLAALAAFSSIIIVSCRLDFVSISDLSVLMKGWPFDFYMSQLLVLGKLKSGGGPIFKVVLEC